MKSVTAGSNLWQGLQRASHQTKLALNPLSWIHRFSPDEANPDLDAPSRVAEKKIEARKGGSPQHEDEDPQKYGSRERIGLFAGPIAFVLLMLLLPVTEVFTPLMRSAAACTAWVAIWWVTEALPIPATSLLPLILFPLTGVLDFGSTAAGYANPNVFLFLGGFMLAVTMQKWNLHRRLALTIIQKVGTNPGMLILGFMVATAFLSMWISNTATAMMMMPIGLAVTTQLASLTRREGIAMDTGFGKFAFGTALMLGIAYSATIGGVGTLIGTPPNAIFASVVGQTFDTEISFAQWLLYGFPIAVVFTAIAWAYLVRAFPLDRLQELKGGRAVIRQEIEELGPMSKGEKMIGTVFFLVAMAWIFRSLLLQDLLPGLSDPLIAVLAAVVLFVLPVNYAKGEFLLDWETAVKIPWGILLLFGGGIAIAAGFTETGLSTWIGGQLAGLEAVSMLGIMFVIVALVILLSNVTSNTGTVSMMLPVMIAMAIAMEVHPYALMITCATAGSFAFMLPVGTPPNAVVFGSRYITIPQMAKAGLLLTIFTILVLPIVTYLWLPIAWGIDLTTFPVGW